MKYQNAIVDQDALTKVNVCVPVWEIAVLQKRYGKSKIQLGDTQVVQREQPDTEAEMGRLVAKYGDKTVSAVYPASGDALDKAISAACKLSKAQVTALKEAAAKSEAEQRAAMEAEIREKMEAEMRAEMRAEMEAKIREEVTAELTEQAETETPDSAKTGS